MPASTPTSSSPGQRLVWADLAKALAIVLVVLHHTVGKHLGFVVPDGLDGVHDAWLAVTYALKPVRMPMFFVVSGLFAASALTRPWREVAPKRVVNVYYLYALWLVIHMVVFRVFETLPMNRTRNMTELVQDLLYASTGLWYLYGLVVYVLLVRLLRGVDPRLVVGLAAIVTLVAPTLPIDEVNRVSLLQHFVYFAFGAYYPGTVAATARMGGRSTVLLTGATLSLAAVLLTADAGVHVTRFILSLFAVPLTLRVAATVVRWPPAAAAGTFLGARTLPIYLLHIPVLAALHPLLADAVGALGDLSVAAMVLYPFVVTALVVAACLLARTALTWAGAQWLFAWPFGSDASSDPGPRARPGRDPDHARRGQMR